MPGRCPHIDVRAHIVPLSIRTTGGLAEKAGSRRCRRDLDCPAARTLQGLNVQDGKIFCAPVELAAHVPWHVARAIYPDAWFRHSEIQAIHAQLTAAICRLAAAHPIADAEGAVVGIKPVIESEDGMARLSPKRLNRMGVAFGKEPNVSRPIVGDHRFVRHDHVSCGLPQIGKPTIFLRGVLPRSGMRDRCDRPRGFVAVRTGARREVTRPAARSP